LSHFTRVRTQLTDRVVLEGALRRMGFTPQPTGKGVGGYLGQRIDASFKIQPRKDSYEIGFVETPTGYTVVADWWGVKGITEKVLLQQLRQQYAVEVTTRTLQDRGFKLEQQSEDSDGTIRLVLHRSVGG